MIERILDHLDEWINLIHDLHKEIMMIYDKPIDVTLKEDRSPVTEADLKVSKMIEEFIVKYYPGIMILCEEKSKQSYEQRKSQEYIFIVDPIDGTKEFINRNGEFTDAEYRIVSPW